MSENTNVDENKKNVGLKNLKHFGIHKPAIPGPGRPRLPQSVKERRALLRQKIEEIAPDAIRVVQEVLNDPKAEDRDRLRASEIALSHTVPKLEEGVMHVDNAPLEKVPDDAIAEILSDAIAKSTLDTPTNGSSGNGATA